MRHLALLLLCALLCGCEATFKKPVTVEVIDCYTMKPASNVQVTAIYSCKNILKPSDVIAHTDENGLASIRIPYSDAMKLLVGDPEMKNRESYTLFRLRKEQIKNGGSPEIDIFNPRYHVTLSPG